MKKRIFSRVLALFMALSMLTTTVFAASFDDLQNAINGENGTKIENSNLTDHYGYGSQDTTTGNWGVESWKEGDASNVKLNEDVVASETTPTITVDEDQKVNLELNNNNITGTAGSDVIDVKGDLTITGGDEGGKNVISGGATGIDVEKGGTLALDSVTVTNNEIGVSFSDNLSVTFIGDQNVVAGNTSKQISGTGKVNFELGEKTYKVDAKTAETLLANKDSVAANGDNWILAKNGEETYTVVYTGTGTSIGSAAVTSAIDGAATAAKCEKSAITGFVIPNEVTEVGIFAFQNRSNLKKVTMHGVTSIGIWAFSGCTALETVELSSCGATSIGDRAFANCTALKTINLSPDIETFKGAAFMGCASLNIDLSQFVHLKTIEAFAFQGSGVSGDIVFPESLTSIGENAFRDCKGLTSLDLSTSSLTVLKQFAFQNCSGLTTITLPDSLTVIGSYVFQGCTGLTGKIEIPANVTKIEQAAFHKCANITDVKFAKDSKLTTIGGNAFYSCTNLKSITLPEGLTSIAAGALFGVTTVIFPSTLTNVEAGAFYPGNTKCAILYYTEGMTAENISTAVEAVKTGSTRVDKNLATNIYVVNGDESVGFYRENITADFVHASVEISETDGSVALTNVSGTITTSKESFTLPNVARITASIDTNGKITVIIPEGGEEYPYGATVTTDPDDPEGEIVVTEGEPDLPVISFDFDAMTADTDTTIDDQAVPLAGLVSLADLLEALREYEGIEDVELPEDFQWLDHDYAQAIYWGLDEALVEDTEDDPLDPDEIVTVALLREVLENFVEYKGVDLTVTVEGEEDDEIVFDLGERLEAFYTELEAALKVKAA